MKKLLFFLFISFTILFAKAQCNEPTDVHFENSDFFYDWINLVITWDTNGMDTWDIEFGEEGFSPTGMPSIENHMEDHISFSDIYLPNSQYFDFYIRANCGGITSNWVGPYTFYKYCTEGPSMGVYADFENEFIPDCWMESDTGTPQTGIGLFGNSTWEQDYFANDTNNSLSAKINISGTDTNAWLLHSLLIGIQGLKSEDTYDLTFDLALTEAGTTNPAQLGADDVFQIVISYDFGATWYTIRSWDLTTPISNTGEQISIQHNAWEDGWDMFFYPFLVAFYASSGAIDDANVDLFIDNVTAFPPATGSVSDFKNLSLTIFPNPVEKSFSILELKGNTEIKIFNNLGQLIKATPLSDNQNTIDVSELEKGIYYLQILANQQVYNSRFIKK